MGLQGFERRLERMVEGVFAKAFRGGIQPVELGKRIAREMDLNKTVGVRGLVSPNAFQIDLSPGDFQKFDAVKEAMERELADAAREHARAEKYQFLGPVQVDIEKNKNLKTGVFMVSSEMREGAGGSTVGVVVTEAGDRVSIGEEPVTIGRMGECDIAVSDPNVSRRHAEVRRRGDDFFVVDLGSTNGTKVNGAGVRERLLQDGDLITVGSTKLRFETS